MNYIGAINWLKRAQDIGKTNDGVSAYYDTRYRLWMPSYPEVSGYIIPTFLAAKEYERALRISRWLRLAQLGNGAGPIGILGSGTPCVFTTGQMLLGWIRAQELEYDPRTGESIDKATDWLEEQWKKDKNSFLPTINTQTVWALKEAYSSYVPEMLDFFEEYIDDNGFPRGADSQQDSFPLSHYIVHVARGFFESERSNLARRIMGKLPSVPQARYNRDWQGNDSICVSGVAQAAILFEKLGMKAEARRGRNYLDTLSGPWASDPADGDYFPGCQVSWSAKFIADAFYEAGDSIS